MIPVCEPLLGEKELEYVTECMKTGWISSSGRFIEEFEQRWAAFCGMKYGVAVCNGTAALQTAVSCIDLQRGDRVIIPAFTIISCALAVIYNGGIPVLVDADPETWGMDVDHLREVVEGQVKKGPGKLRAIMPVHIYGHPVDMDPIRELADRYGLMVIEDAAEAHGAEYLTHRSSPGNRWEKCGSLGHINAFSFYANKIITTGEGGMILTDNPILAEKAGDFRNLCFQRSKRFIHEALGHNFRMTNLQAAIGVAQLESIQERIGKKRWIGKTYFERLNGVSGLQLPVEKEWARQVYWMYGIVLDEKTGMDAAAFAAILKENGIETRPFFIGMHEQPVLRKMGLFTNEHYPVAQRIARQGLYLPSGLTITESQIDQVCETVRTLISKKNPVNPV